MPQDTETTALIPIARRELARLVRLAHREAATVAVDLSDWSGHGSESRVRMLGVRDHAGRTLPATAMTADLAHRVESVLLRLAEVGETDGWDDLDTVADHRLVPLVDDTEHPPVVAAGVDDAARAVRAYTERLYLPDSREQLQTVCERLVADLCHLLAARRVDPLAALRAAVTGYLSEADLDATQAYEVRIDARRL